MALLSTGDRPASSIIVVGWQCFPATGRCRVTCIQQRLTTDIDNDSILAAISAVYLHCRDQQ